MSISVIYKLNNIQIYFIKYFNHFIFLFSAHVFNFFLYWTFTFCTQMDEMTQLAVTVKKKNKSNVLLESSFKNKSMPSF